MNCETVRIHDEATVADFKPTSPGNGVVELRHTAVAVNGDPI
jgi:hypothetical protein